VVDGRAVIGDAPDTVRDAIAEALRRDKGATVQTDDGLLFIQVFNSPLRLMVIGAVHIAQTLVPIASLAGYDVTVIDPRRAFASDARFPGVRVRQDWPDEALEELGPDARTAVVTLTHDPKLDDPALDVALRSDAFYIAALGSRRTHAARLERLGALGHDAPTLGRIHGPAGLAIGAVSPAEVAIAVMAEMTRVLRQPSGGPS
jgi:xanthine dehydrogenase accessory factor